MKFKLIKKGGKVFYDFKRTNNILNTLNITANQAWICIMLLEQNFNYKKELFINYVEKHDGIDYMDILKLEELGYIEDCGSNNEIEKTVTISVVKKGNKYEKTYRKLKNVVLLDLLIVTPLFKEKVYIDPEVAAEEVLKAYPAWMIIKGSRTYLKGIPSDKEPFYEYYNSIIQGDILKHKFIVEMFKHVKRLTSTIKNGNPVLNPVGLVKALESKLYNDIEELLALEEAEKDVGTQI